MTQIRLVKIVINKITFFVLLFNSICFSQTKDTINYSSVSQDFIKEYREIGREIYNDKLYKKYKRQDTLFLFFKDSKSVRKSQSLKNKKYNNIKFIDTVTHYSYTLNDSSNVSFRHEKFFNFDAIVENDSSIILKKKKCFIRRNKKSIVKNTFFTRNKEVDYTLRMLLEIVNTKKILFIIDEDEFADKQIILRQVILDKSSNKFFEPKM